MNRKAWSYFLLLTFILALASTGYAKDDKKNKQLNKTNTNDFYTTLDINQCYLYINNNGDGSKDPITDGAGFYWPGGVNATQTAIFQDGLVWGGKIGREIRVGGSEYRHGLQAGKILANGLADDPSLPKYRIYKIRKDWGLFPPGAVRDALKKDYDEWPVEDGAPWVDVNGDGVYTAGVDEPQFIGDEVLWYVSNDLDPSRTSFMFGTQPIGLEQQCTVFGFKRTGDLGDIVFKKYKLINKGTSTIKEMYLAYWSDTDIGDGNDDFSGCDTTLSLGYTYNGTNNDKIYGAAPPAVGYDFFQGPVVKGAAQDSAKFLGKWKKGLRNLPMTAYSFFINSVASYSDPSLGTAAGAQEMYNYMQGLVWNGNNFIDPNTGLTTKFILTGDPVAGTGWYEGKGWPSGQPPGDRRHVMASGPFEMAPGDTQEVVVGIIIARGVDNINSVTELKRKDKSAQIAYDLDFNLTPSPETPLLHTVALDRAVTLWWEPNAEKYTGKDPLLPDKIRLSVNGRDTLINVTSKNYAFEGYRVWQYKDLAGSEPVLLGVYDIKNGIKDVYNYIYDFSVINGQKNPVALIKAPDDGIRRFINISTDAYSNGPLYNGTPYYFGVTAYGVSRFSDPPFLEASPQIMEVRPMTAKIDLNTPYNTGNFVKAEQTKGYSDGLVRFRVVDPLALTGDHYKVEIYGTRETNNLKYTLINATKGDTLIKNATDFVKYNTIADTINKPVIQGFMLYVQDLALDSIAVNAPENFGVKSVLEFKGPNSADLGAGKNVLNQLNSTKKWMVKVKGTPKRLNFQDKKASEGLGYDDYEIRFNGTSQFFANGYLGGFADPITKPDAKGNGTLPFRVYNIGRNRTALENAARLSVKILDKSPADTTRAIPDLAWTRLPNGDWEEIFAYSSTLDNDNLPAKAPTSKITDYKFGQLSFSGEVPEAGTVVKIVSWKPMIQGDVYEADLVAAKLNDVSAAAPNLKKISVYPNPYFGANALERDKYQRFVRFTNLPKDVTVKIFSLAGIFIKNIVKSDNSPWLDWDLRNTDGFPVSSGMYIAYLDMPGIGTKILKIAVILETQYIDRL